MKFKRIILIILDGVGAGYLPDADKYGDVGSNTLLHVHESQGLSLPNMSRLGLSNIIPLSTSNEVGAWGKMAEKSAGKDTTTGHWELSGVILEEPFPTYPQGFPDEVLKPFCEKIGTGILGNYPASGTEIIKELGDEHVSTGKPIIYTSADSVLQIAAHEEVIPLERLYEMCQWAREILCGKHAVGRVIARPFIGETGQYSRTKNRRDFSLQPFGTTILDALSNSGHEAIGVGKIEDIFAQRGLSQSFPVKGNPACFDATLQALKEDFSGLIFTNLVDFDMLYGHRNNPKGFAEALEYFDQRLPEVYDTMGSDDLLIITADHGNDPTTASTDHSREYVPLLVFHKAMSSTIELGVRSSFADIAKTIDENFDLQKITNGESFLASIA